jgi:hypothetical protein
MDEPEGGAKRLHILRQIVQIHSHAED